MIINKIPYRGHEGIPSNKIPANACEKNTGDWRTNKPVIDLDKCKSCKRCYIYCPDVAIKWVDDKPVINYHNCKNCGICRQECPMNAIYEVKE